MNTNTMEQNLEELEMVNGGLFDDLFNKAKEVWDYIAEDAKQTFCSHSYIRTGVTRMRPFCSKDVLQHELFCPKCNHKKWVED